MKRIEQLLWVLALPYVAVGLVEYRTGTLIGVAVLFLLLARSTARTMRANKDIRRAVRTLS